VVDRDGLENRCTFTGTVGSNPTLSANSKQLFLLVFMVEFEPSVRRGFPPLSEPSRHRAGTESALRSASLGHS
jgi:hypothetical protein